MKLFQANEAKNAILQERRALEDEAEHEKSALLSKVADLFKSNARLEETLDRQRFALFITSKLLSCLHDICTE